MDIAGSGKNPLGNDHVHEADDRLLAGVCLGNVELFRRLRPHPLEQLVDRLVRPVHLVELLADFRRGEQEQPDLTGRRERERLLGVDIERICSAQLEVGVGQPERQDAVAARDLLGDAVAGGLVDFADVGDLQPEAVRQLLDYFGIRRDLLGDDAFPQRPARLRLRPKRLKALGREGLKGCGQPLVWE